MCIQAFWTEISADRLNTVLDDLLEELKITKRQRIREIMKRPEQETLIQSSQNREDKVFRVHVISNGDPLEIYTTREGEVIFKKYSLLGGLEDFAAQFCDALNRTSGFTAAVTDRDAVIAITGAGKRELLGKSLSEALSRVMEERRIYCCQGADQPLPVTDGNDRYTAAVAAPILCEGDVLGLVLFLSAEGQVPGEGEYKLAQTVSAFLGKHMES